MILPLFFLYAETHYSFKGVYSRLKKKEPEVIADAPHRVEPGQAIPVLLLIKDSDKFAITVNRVTIDVYAHDEFHKREVFPINSGMISQKYYATILHIEPGEQISGLIKLDVIIEISDGQRTKVYQNDNYRISSHQPLEVYRAERPLPRSAGWYFGDMHCHTSYTEDQAEFGVPLEPAIQLSKALGLHFFAAVDHSYDLDDHEANFLVNDSSLKKWHRFQQEVAVLNQTYPDFVILPGEEASAGNAQNRNVHFLILNNDEFIPGKGDSAEHWFQTKPDLSISEILQRIEDKALAIAAHAEMPPPFLQRLLIRRGKWQWLDYLHPRLNGMQIWNGVTDYGFQQGLQRWVELLLHCRRIFIFAGTDAHGNFNRFRQIGFPFWTFREMNKQIFGAMRTAVRTTSPLTVQNLIDAMKNGRCLITDGPFVEFELRNENGDMADIGGEMTGDSLTMTIHACSSAEFGSLQKLIIYYGNVATKEERVLQMFDYYQQEYEFNLRTALPFLSRPAYVRLELETTKDQKIHRCLTNPIWVK